VEDPKKPVTWSLAFRIHAILKGIIEVGKELYAITKVSKIAFETFFCQVNYAENCAMNEEDMHQTPVWKHNINMVLFLENYGLEVFE